MQRMKNPAQPTKPGPPGSRQRIRLLARKHRQRKKDHARPKSQENPELTTGSENTIEQNRVGCCIAYLSISAFRNRRAGVFRSWLFSNFTATRSAVSSRQ